MQRQVDYGVFVILIATAFAWGCGDLADDGTPQADFREISTKSSSSGCVITMCLTGAMSHETPSNEHFAKLCSNAEIKGLVRDCWDGTCKETFDSFLQFPLLTVYPELVKALDRDQDGKITDADPVCDVRILGFSWGGVNALSVAQHLQNDYRVPTTHKAIDKVVLVDAFQPWSGHRMTVPKNVSSVLSVRHSVTSHNDCSANAPLGPYLGLPPICGPDQDCNDYDFSAERYTLYEPVYGYAVHGIDVGHCEVPRVAHRAVVNYLNDKPYAHELPAPVN